MQQLTLILTSAITWETVGFICAIVLLCGRPVRMWIKQWINKNNTKIQEDIQSATQLEQEAGALLKQYKQQASEQQQQLDMLKKQNQQELMELKENIAQKTTDAIQQQKEATAIHIRLVATRHQQKMMAGILDQFINNVSAYFKRQKKENMDASICHLFNSLKKESEIIKNL